MLCHKLTSHCHSILPSLALFSIINLKDSKNFAIRRSIHKVTSKSVFFLLQVDTEAALIRMGKNSFSVNMRYWPFLLLRTRLGQLCVRL